MLTGSRPLFAEAFATTATVTCRIGERLGMSKRVQAALMNLFEQWDATGQPHGLARSAIP